MPLDRPIELWTLTVDDTEPQPVPGSGCSTAGFDEEPAGSLPEPEPYEPTIEERCQVERRNFETAVEAFTAENGDERPPTESELVEIGYALDPFDRWDLDGWEVVPAPGRPCEQIYCIDQVRTVHTAAQAFYAENGFDPAHIDELDPYLRDDVRENFRIGDDGAIVPVDGAPCAAYPELLPE